MILQIILRPCETLKALLTLTFLCLIGLLQAELVFAGNETVIPSQYVKQLIILKEQAEITNLSIRLKESGVRIARRHEAVLRELQSVSQRSQSSIIDELDALKQAGKVIQYRSLFIANIIAVEATPDAIEQIASLSGVFRIEDDPPIEVFHDSTFKASENGAGFTNDNGEKSTESGLRLIRAPEVWRLGITGAGVLVAHLDTGVNGLHPALQGKWRGSNGYPASASWYDPVTFTTFPTDYDGHGTQTMGIICGMVTGDTIGVAWGAQYISAGVIDRVSSIETISDALESFQWMIDPDGNPATFEDVPRVISNSWGLPIGFYAPCDATFNTAIDNCEAAGSAVVWAAGNEGPSAGTVRVPAMRASTPVNSFAVGGYNQSAGTIWSSSSRGPSPCSSAPDVLIKPEVVAPCASVRSSGLGSNYVYGTGTSFSAPHTAGTLALMTEANPELTPDSLKKILLLTASDKGDPKEDNTYGCGLIDALTAVRGALGGIGWISGRITDELENGIAAEITIVDHPHHFYADTNGYFKAAFPADLQFTLRVNASTYQQTTQTVTLAAGDTLWRDFVLIHSLDATLSGLVVDCFGQGASNALVRASNGNQSETFTNEIGRFELLLPSGIYSVYADDGICGDTTLSNIQIVGGGVTDIEIILPDNPNLRCSNPDGMGYRVCDDQDQGGPTYVWYEALPQLGGKGTVNNLADDASTTLALPFPVTFYGTTYQRIFLNSDGILSFEKSLTNHTNSLLPQNTALGIFAFWDNLNDQAGGDIITDYDPAKGIFVAEWRNIPLVNLPNYESFEVILYNSAVYPTTTGNTIIEAHYARVDSAYSCTIGIDARDSVNYLQYLYNGVSPDHASPLQSGRSLRYVAGNIVGGNPSVLISSPTITFHLDEGCWLDTTLIVQNIGSAPLAYRVAFRDSMSSSLTQKSSDTLNRGFNRTGTMDSGGLDANGYAWISSQEAGGPSYQYFDISGIGQNTGLALDDTTSDPVQLPWFFPFYYRLFDQVSICSNGYLSFTSCVASWLNSQCASTANPFYLISPFWDDLDLRRGGGVYTYFDAELDRFIVQYSGVYHRNSGGPYNFQAILYHDGSIEIVYGTMTGQVISATVGLKGRGGSESLQMIYNQPFVQSNLLIHFSRPQEEYYWCRITNLNQGVIPAQSSIAIPIELRNDLQPSDLHTGIIDISCSDPVTPNLSAYLTLDGRPEYVFPSLVITPSLDGVMLNWRRWNTPYYCIYSGGTQDSVYTQLVGSVADTFMFVPFTTDRIRFFEVRACDGLNKMENTSPSGERKISLTNKH